MKQLDGPKTPAFWQRLQWVFDPIGYMETAQKDHPDLFIAEVVGFGNTVVFATHPEALQYILTNDRKQLSAPGDINRILEPLIGGSSVIMLAGEQHRKRRQLVMPSFHGERMRNYGDLIVNLTQKVMNQFSAAQPFLARTAMQEISLQVMLEAVFGLYEGERCQKLKHLLESMTDTFRSPLTSAFLFFPFLQRDLGAWSPWGNFLHQRQQIDALIYAEIAERRAQNDPSRTDILSMLMAAEDEQGQPMTDSELRDELMTLLFAGHETTATAMAWALYWIHSQPDVKQKLLEELAGLGECPEWMDIARLPYLTAVCHETLRIHPVAMLTFPRVVQEPIELMGYTLEQGTFLMGCMYLIHQREDIYPDHKAFKPERFLERQFSPYEFIPFGGGVRRCLGEALAQFEMKLVLATILSRYEMELADKRPEIPRRRGVTLAPTRGVKMVMKGLRSRLTSSSELIGSSV